MMSSAASCWCWRLVVSSEPPNSMDFGVMTKVGRKKLGLACAHCMIVVLSDRLFGMGD